MSDIEKGAGTAALAREIVEEISVGDLLTRIDALRSAGWRLVQMMGIATADSVELDYSFGLDRLMRVFRFHVAPAEPVPSITSLYAGAYLYENEIRDLFGVAIERISVDWLGKVYDQAGDKPFEKISIRLPSVEGGRP
jgi:ech hydrogenase subunit D